MQRDRMRRTFGRLGIDLKLLPLVYVAWCSGSMSRERAERLVDLAHDHFAIGAAGERVLRTWLEERPKRAYFAEGLRDLFSLARAEDETAFNVEELPGLLAYSEAIARTTALAMDAPTAVTASEERALADIARVLGVEDGVSWATLLRQLETPPHNEYAGDA